MENQSRRGYIAAFLLPMVILFLAFAIFHIFPFGTKTISTSDMSNQYIAIMSYFKNNLFHIGNLKYTFSVGLGINFFSVLTYYLMSPINLLALLFPSQYIPIFFELNLVIDICLISLTTYFFFRNSTILNHNRDKNSEIWGILFSISFALCNYFIAYSINVMWFNVVILFPIVLFSFEKIILGGNRLSHFWYYALLTLSIIINYYIGLMLLIFLALIGVWWVVIETIRRTWTKRQLLICLFLITDTILAIGTSTIVTLPSYVAQKGVEQSTFVLSLNHLYSAKQLIASPFTGAVRGDAPLITVNIMCLLIVAYYLFSKQFSVKNKVVSLSFLVTLMLSSWFMTPYMMWHAFSMPNGFHQRESFLIVFVICALSYYILNSVNYLKVPLLLLSAGSVLVILSIGFLLFKLIPVNYYVINVIALIVSLFSLLLYYKKKFYQKVIICLMFVSPIIIVLASFYPFQKTLAFMNLSSYQKVEQPTRKAIDSIKIRDKGFYRIGSAYQINMNDPLLYNYPGVSGYVSQQPTAMTDYLSSLGYYQKHQWFRWSQYNNGSTRAVDSLLGIKYVLNSNQNIIRETQQINSFPTFNLANNLYSKKVLRGNNIVVMKNNNAFPMTFTLCKNTINSLIYNPSQNIFEQLNFVFSNIAGNKKMYTKNVINNIDDNSDTFNILASQTGEMYLYIPTNHEKLPEEIVVYVNGKKINTLFGKNLNGENGICPLGFYKNQSSINVKIKGLSSKMNPLIYSENQDLLNKLTAASNNNHVQMIKKSNSSLVIKTDKNFKSQKLGIAIPYNQAWRAKIDGKSLATEPCLGYLTSVNVPNGSHKLTFRYEVPWLKEGSIISLICVIAFCAEYYLIFLKQDELSN